MKLRIYDLDINTTHPFGISRGTEQVFRNVIVELEHDGLTGTGEAAPSSYYGETKETVLAAIPVLEEVMRPDPFLIEDTVQHFESALGRNPAAKACIEMAMFDLVGKMLDVPLYRYFNLDPHSAPTTTYTISLGDPGLLEAKLLEASSFPVLKIKVGHPEDLEAMKRVRAVTDKTVRLDANGAWAPREAVRRIKELCEFGIEFVEQPVPAYDIEGLRFVRNHVDVPIMADESAVVPEDIPKLAGAVDGINIKLMKCGGLLNALKMIHIARAHDMMVMLGCMIESSVAITAAAHLSPLVDYADLDGNLLIETDPYQGVTVSGGRLHLPKGPGLGTEERPDPGA